MTTPNPVINARERLIKSIEHWCRVIHDNLPSGGPQIAAAVAADLFGDIVPDITPPDGHSTHIGPVGQLAMWFALYCEESGIMAPGETLPAGIEIDPKLLIPLLSLHPVTFGIRLYHPCAAGVVDGKVLCIDCSLNIEGHFVTQEKLYMAEIESLRSDIEVLEATTDIQMQAIVKQTEAIEALANKSDHPVWPDDYPPGYAYSAYLNEMKGRVQSKPSTQCPHFRPAGEPCGRCDEAASAMGQPSSDINPDDLGDV